MFEALVLAVTGFSCLLYGACARAFVRTCKIVRFFACVHFGPTAQHIRRSTHHVYIHTYAYLYVTLFTHIHEYSFIFIFLLPWTTHQFVHRAMTKARKYTAHAILYFTVPYYSTLYFCILSLHTSYLIYVYMYIYTYFSMYSICKHIHKSFHRFHIIWIMEWIISIFGAWILRFRVKIKRVCKIKKAKIQHFPGSLDLRRQKKSKKNPPPPRVLGS